MQELQAKVLPFSFVFTGHGARFLLSSFLTKKNIINCVFRRLCFHKLQQQMQALQAKVPAFFS